MTGPGWEYRPPRRPHMCLLPEAPAATIPAGTVWRCDVCRRRWQVVLPARDSDTPDECLLLGERRGPDRAVWQRVALWWGRWFR